MNIVTEDFLFRHSIDFYRNKNCYLSFFIQILKGHGILEGWNDVHGEAGESVSGY